MEHSTARERRWPELARPAGRRASDEARLAASAEVRASTEEQRAQWRRAAEEDADAARRLAAWCRAHGDTAEHRHLEALAEQAEREAAHEAVLLPVLQRAAVEGRDPAAALALGQALCRRGEPEAAAPWLERAVAQDPRTTVTAAHAYCCLSRRRAPLARSQRWLHRALRHELERSGAGEGVVLAEDLFGLADGDDGRPRQDWSVAVAGDHPERAARALAATAARSRLVGDGGHEFEAFELDPADLGGAPPQVHPGPGGPWVDLDRGGAVSVVVAAALLRVLLEELRAAGVGAARLGSARPATG
ncbi:hypothetical protein [Kineococcus sp. SYSU DK006]|uniref:hypothetical protein n=1 Tax=Kineococcus sp. SYSU DK006 TaxID=3383127 RepID=UPI003D7EFB13